MLSKEEKKIIEAYRKLKEYGVKNISLVDTDVYDLNLIDQLEQENKKQNESAYWKGYIQKQQESMEICKMCKFRKQYFEKKVEGK